MHVSSNEVYERARLRAFKILYDRECQSAILRQQKAWYLLRKSETGMCWVDPKYRWNLIKSGIYIAVSLAAKQFLWILKYHCL